MLLQNFPGGRQFGFDLVTSKAVVDDSQNFHTHYSSCFPKQLITFSFIPSSVFYTSFDQSLTNCLNLLKCNKEFRNLFLPAPLRHICIANTVAAGTAVREGVG